MTGWAYGCSRAAWCPNCRQGRPSSTGHWPTPGRTRIRARRRQARSAPAGGWRTSARFLADVRAGRKGKLAKRKEWQQRFNKPPHHDDGKRESYPLIPTGDREARPLSRKAKESLRQESNDEVPEEHERIWREKPKTPGERAGKRRREAARKQRKKEAGAEAPQEAAPKQKELVGRLHQLRVRTPHPQRVQKPRATTAKERA